MTMGWADQYILSLELDDRVSFRPRGNSMQGKINSGALVTLIPPRVAPVVGDIVLCKVKGKQYLHLVTALKSDGGKRLYQISNNKGHVNGWIRLEAIYGKVISIES